jgi:cellulose synthase/poly-beta-1,6-N-acetylglucosamine synthase-like glycosyltransferase
MTILIAAHNEERHITDKIENCLALDYPPARLDILVVSDGSTDRTTALVEEYAARFSHRVKLVALPVRGGKAQALNSGAVRASGEILLLADVRQRFDLQVARALAQNFADPEVGAVSGELLLCEDGAAGHPKGLGLYWRYEKALRLAESRCGSTMGYSGAISAIRRSLFTPLPEDTLVDDLITPLQVVARGYRVVVEPTAHAFDRMSTTPGHEFARKVRTLAGVTQTFLRLPRLVGTLGPRAQWQFWSHKVMRLIVPYALVAALLASTLLDGPFYQTALAVQVVMYGLGVMGMVSGEYRGWRRLTSAPCAFLMLNVAAVTGVFRYLAGRRLDLWQPLPSERPTGN